VALTAATRGADLTPVVSRTRISVYDHAVGNRRQLTVFVAVLAAGCGSVPPSTTVPASLSASNPGPSLESVATQQPGLPWQYADITQPVDVITVPSLLPGYQCHPCHYVAENDLFAVSTWANGLISVGSLRPPARPLAFTSTDGTSWDVVAGLTAAADATSAAVATLATRTVLVGNEHNGATAWAFDGQTWQQAPEQDALHVDYAAGGMNAVVAVGDGTFVAGGYRDDPLHDKRNAGAWRSVDGLNWSLDPDPGSEFEGGRIWSMATRDGTVVAVGTNGDVIYGPAGAWYWTAAGGWQRAQFTPDAGGAMAAVIATAGGFLAVGKNATDLGASVWTSTDGKMWTREPDQPSFHYYQLPLRMQAIAVSPTGYLVGGWRSDVGKGSAVLWRSSDGLTWTDPEWQTTFSGGEITGVALTDALAIAVGRTGYPDWDRATIWTRPLPY